MKTSLLDHRLLTVRTSSGEVGGKTLPEVFASLVKDELLAFEALQPHQQQAWHAFLVQTAAMAAAREAGGEIPTSAAAWREALVALSGGEEAWRLVTADLTKPAFMQPPVPEGSLKDAGFKSDVTSPDLLDVLITSKNFDVKMERIDRPRPEHWLFALCTLQTMEGFLGYGNYGVVRMNGGFGNRPMVGYTGSLTWGGRFRRDLEVLLARRDDFADRYDPGGYALLWTEPWRGGKKEGIPIEACDPYFVEVCRRIRFTLEGGELLCWRTNTKAQRVDAPDSMNGMTGDPWTPVDKANAKALTVGENGFTYDLLRQIAFESNYEASIALEFRPGEEEGAYLVARTLVRGQGKTDGLHMRVVPVSKKAVHLFSDPTDRERLGNRAEKRVRIVADVRKRVLYPAVAALVSSGRDGKVDWDQAEPWFEGFEKAIDDRFFEALWASVEMEETEAERQWQRIVQEEAERQFEEAERSVPLASIHSWQARSKARSIFEGSCRRVLPFVYTTNDVEA